MYSSEDLERFYFQYQTEGLPHGESIQHFCVKNKVPYNIFSKWYKDTRKQIVEVQVAGRPSEADHEPTPQCEPAQPSSPSPVRILVELRMSNGLHVSQKNLSYRELVHLVEKLEVLC
ncbi:MAG: hypothetical protein SPF35_00920 [Prevotella sp.]|nr:hypothetical protein [Prevotella sp.]